MKRIAFFLPTLHGGGAEKVVLNLLKGMTSKNLAIDLILASTEGPYLKQIPEFVNVINLAAGRAIKAIFPLAQYLKQYQPHVLISHMSHANVIAILASKLTNHKTKLILVEHNTFSAAESSLFRARLIPPLMRLLYPQADTIVGVSQNVAQDIAAQLNLNPQKVKTIYNPVVDEELFTKANARVEHPWFTSDKIPIFLAVGRLTKQKDFSTLIKAFALVKEQVAARLMILGEGECRQELEATISNLHLQEDVALPGFVDNPYAYMKQAKALVLSSRWEGLPTVLIEAMACGCPVVSTDCPSGPHEILAGGKYGQLVFIGDEVGLANAMINLINSNTDREQLIQRGMKFSVSKSTSEYLQLLLEL